MVARWRTVGRVVVVVDVGLEDVWSFVEGSWGRGFLI